MSIHIHSTRTRARSTVVIPKRPSRGERRRTVEARRLEGLETVDPAVTRAEAERRRWLELLGAPCATFALFFAVALSTGTEWPMVPAFVLGPALMIIAYIYLMLTCDTNNEGGAD